MTARNVAGLRREFHRPVLATGDAVGDDRLAAAVQLRLPWQSSRFRAYLRARTDFFDQELLRACDAGVRQVVIVGAGYDGRALRFRRPDVSFVEVDHATTQADKRRRLVELGIESTGLQFVAVDLRSDPIDLSQTGHDDGAPTFFLCEGLTPYLRRGDLERLLGALRGHAAPGSLLAIDFAVPTAGRRWQSRMLVGLWRASAVVTGELVVTALAPDEVRELLRQAGWEQVSYVNPADRSSDPGSLPAVFATAVP